ncbi:D-tyrosyl-tRNA(Tyr) deacylase [bacterium]|nr:MAG: D-tyrosyl-tRNA(Tyr) deacylase [bacterium]
MRALIQRVRWARVRVHGEVKGEIGKGFLVLLGVKKGDTEKDAEYLAKKTVNLRIFENEKGKFDLSLLDVNGELLVVSQFTLYGDTRRGRRPDFTRAEEPGKAKELYEKFIEYTRSHGVKVEEGIFGERMEVELLNDGPVTIILESE